MAQFVTGDELRAKKCNRIRLYVLLYKTLTYIRNCIVFVNTPKQLFPSINLMDAESWFLNRAGH